MSPASALAGLVRAGDSPSPAPLAFLRPGEAVWV